MIIDLTPLKENFASAMRPVADALRDAASRISWPVVSGTYAADRPYFRRKV